MGNYHSSLYIMLAMHFRSFQIDEAGVEGEMTIDDLVLFAAPGPLERVERMWTAVKKYSLMVDANHFTMMTYDKLPFRHFEENLS